MGNYVKVDDSNFDQEVLQSDVPVLVDFWAPWCGPCRTIAPHVEALGAAHAGKLKVAKVNVDESQRVALKFRIQSIPTILVFKGGEIANRLVGLPPNVKGKLQQLVEPVL